MTEEKKRRDIRKEIDALKKKAEDEFHRKGLSEPARGFLERASVFDPAVESRQPDGTARRGAENGKGGDRGIILGRLRDIIRNGRSEVSEEHAEEAGDYLDLEDAVPGEETFFGPGSFYRILESSETLEKGIGRRYLDIFSGTFLRNGTGRYAELELLTDLSPEQVCFLDIETTGLKSSPLFLIGLLYQREGDLIIDQFLARDYSEERALLEFTSYYMNRFRSLVTFNGKSFDIPYIQERMTVLGVNFFSCGNHLDLLHTARGIVGGRVPNHKLQTLEKFLLGRKRVDDTPGHVIPGLYHDFVKTGNASDIAGIIRHNRIDLISMVRLVMLFLSDYQR